MELTLSNLIKIIIGLVVVVAVGIGLYLFFSGHVIDFFRNMNVNTSTAKLIFVFY